MKTINSKLTKKLMMWFLIIICGLIIFMALLATTVFNKLNQLALNIAMIICFLFFGLGIFTLCYIAVYNIVIKRISLLNESMKEVTKGNYEIEIFDKNDDEIGELSDSFNKMIYELKANYLLSKNFTRYVSHEFKTPLCIIRNYAELSSNSNDLEQIKKNMTVIEDEVKDLDSLSRNILTLCKVDSTNYIEKEDAINLASQIKDIIIALQNIWEAKEIEFNLSLENIEMKTNKELLNIVWKNLIMNAIKFSPNKEKIKIDLYEEEEYVSFKITDHGIGINSYDYTNIFQPFFMGDKSHNKDGHGLGLTLCKSIIEKLNGKISFISHKNRGTAFLVKIPKS